MHIIGDIPHSRYKITIFKMNHRLALKVEDQGYEQWYKFRDGELPDGLNTIKQLVDDDFLLSATKVFGHMHKTKISLLEKKSSGDSFEEII